MKHLSCLFDGKTDLKKIENAIGRSNPTGLSLVSPKRLSPRLLQPSPKTNFKVHFIQQPESAITASVLSCCPLYPDSHSTHITTSILHTVVQVRGINSPQLTQPSYSTPPTLTLPFSSLWSGPSLLTSVYDIFIIYSKYIL